MGKQKEKKKEAKLKRGKEDKITNAHEICQLSFSNVKGDKVEEGKLPLLNTPHLRHSIPPNKNDVLISQSPFSIKFVQILKTK